MPSLKIDRKSIDPEIKKFIEEFDPNPESILEIFQELQSRFGYLNRETIETVSHELQVPPHHGMGIASFFSMLSINTRPSNIIRICDGPVCWLCGSDNIRHEAEALYENQTGWHIERSSCLGLCDRAPAALVKDEQVGPIGLEEILGLSEGWCGDAIDYSDPLPGEVRVMLENAGKINPDSLDSAIKYGAYQAMKKIIDRPASSVIDEIENSGLSGRGGAGFPVGRKWRYVSQEDRTPKYVICNADESEPLLFKDRTLIDMAPHRILEGMAIAGYTTGAEEGIIYIRGEYEPQARRLESAIKQAENENFLGTEILGSEFSFHIHLHRGAGAYICGEETALIESLEGKRGEPRLRPPYPPSYGFRGQPTLVNNVETFASIPPIVLNGSDWYHSISSYSTPGTKIYIILGHVNQPRLFEAPFGLTLRQIIDNFGGGMKNGSMFNFALTGGAAGTIVPPFLLDIPLDYSSAGKGISLGAGAFLILDQTISVVSLLREIMHFFMVESCGKCTPCRVGTYRAHEILTQMSNCMGQKGYTEELLSLADILHDSSFCGLGQSASIPIYTALKHFKELFLETEVS